MILKQAACAAIVASTLVAVSTASAAENPIFGNAKHQALTTDQNSQVVGQGANADQYGYYGVLYAQYAEYYGNYGRYYNTYSQERNNYYNAYYYAYQSYRYFYAAYQRAGT